MFDLFKLYVSPELLDRFACVGVVFQALLQRVLMRKNCLAVEFDFALQMFNFSLVFYRPRNLATVSDHLDQGARDACNVFLLVFVLQALEAVQDE